MFDHYRGSSKYSLGTINSIFISKHRFTQKKVKFTIYLIKLTHDAGSAVAASKVTVRPNTANVSEQVKLAENLVAAKVVEIESIGKLPLFLLKTRLGAIA